MKRLKRLAALILASGLLMTMFAGLFPAASAATTLEEVFVDDLNDFSKVYSYTEGLGFGTPDEDSSFCKTTSNETEGSVVYHFDNKLITSFEVLAYGSDQWGKWVTDVKVSGSPDGINYTPIEVNMSTPVLCNNTYWSKATTTPKAALPNDIRYLKVIIPVIYNGNGDNGVNPWETQIGQVKLNLVAEETNVALGKPATASASEYGEPSAALDGDGGNTKWCTTQVDCGAWREVDLQDYYALTKWRVFNGDPGYPDQFTRDFSLQVYDELQQQWVDIDTVVGNTDQITNRTLTTPVVANKVRLYITTCCQPDCSAPGVRICELEVYGAQAESGRDLLGQKIEEVKTMTYHDYTAESWEAFEATLEGAKALYADETALDISLRQEVTKIEEAIANLKNIPASDVVVNLDKIQSPATHKYTGFLFGITETAPSDEVVKAIKPYSWRIGFRDDVDPRGDIWAGVTPVPTLPIPSAQKLYPRLVELGVSNIQVLISDWLYEGCSGNGKSYAEAAQDVVTFGRENSWDFDNLSFDILNEPDWFAPGVPNYIGTIDGDGWYELGYKQAYDVIRRETPNVKIVGPSISQFKFDLLEEFVRMATEDNSMPDTLSWHFSDPRNVEQDVAKVRAMLKKYGHEDTPISINEIVWMGDFNSGRADWPTFYLAQAERAQIDSVIHACWEDMGDGPTAQHPVLNGILSYPELKPRAPYWVYKFYADMSGNMVRVNTASAQTGWEGLGSMDTDTKTARIMVAGGNGTMNLDLSGIKSVGFGDDINVKVEYVTTNGAATVDAPFVLSQKNYRAEEDTLVVPIKNTITDTSYMITITDGKGDVVTNLDLPDAKNVALGKPATASASEYGAPSAALDGDGGNTKWCTTQVDNGAWMEVDLQGMHSITGWKVFNGDPGYPDQYTKDYSLQVYDAEQQAWVDVDAVVGNTAQITERKLVEPIITDKVRLNITSCCQSGCANPAVRICEFEVYGYELSRAELEKLVYENDGALQPGDVKDEDWSAYLAVHNEAKALLAGEASDAEIQDVYVRYLAAMDSLRVKANDFTDDLDDFSKVYARTDGMGLAHVAGDNSICKVQGNEVEESIYYHLDGKVISTFEILSYGCDQWGKWVTDIKASGSPDGVTFTPIEVNLSAAMETGEDYWRKATTTPAVALPDDIRYLKVTIPVIVGGHGASAGVSDWTTQIGQVKLGLAKDTAGELPAIAVTSVTFPQAEYAIPLNDTLTVTPSVEPFLAEGKTLTYSSSNPNVATVDQTGKVTPVADGETTITATAVNGVRGSYKLTVKAPVEILIDELDDWSKIYDRTDDLSFAGMENSGTIMKTQNQTEQSIFYHFDEKVISSFEVSSYGNNQAGKYVTDIEVSGSPDGVTFTPIELNTTDPIDIGEYGYMKVFNTPKAELPADIRYLKVTIPVITDGNGNVCADNWITQIGYVKLGLAEDTEEAPEVTVSAVTFPRAEYTIFSGGTLHVQPTIEPVSAVDKTLTYTSSDPKVATVDQDGKVTAIACGEATITATATNGVSGSYKLTVLPAADDFTDELDDWSKVYSKTDGLQLAAMEGKGTICKAQNQTEESIYYHIDGKVITSFEILSYGLNQEGKFVTDVEISGSSDGVTYTPIELSTTTPVDIAEYGYWKVYSIPKETLPEDIHYLKVTIPVISEGNGDVCADHWITQIGSVKLGLEDAAVEIEPELTSETYVLDDQSGTIGGVAFGTSEADFLAAFTAVGGELEVVNTVEGMVGTGAVLNFKVDGVVQKSYTVVLLGDVTGDGAITSDDIIALKKHISGLQTLEGAYLAAGNASRDAEGAVSSDDIIALKKHISGLASLPQGSITGDFTQGDFEWA